MTTVPTLGYWDIRAFAQPIRYLLKYTGIQFNDKRYPFGEGSTAQELNSIRKHWYSEKFTLGLDFPNLPFYLDGDVKLTQSITILRYVGRKYGLVAKDDKSIAKQDMIEQQLQDLKMKLILVVFNHSEYQKAKKTFLEEILPQQLDLLSKFLGKNEWLNANISYVDFFAYEILDWFRVFSPNCLDKWQNLSQYMKRFEELPAIASYMSSNEFKSWPITSPTSNWGYWKT